MLRPSHKRVLLWVVSVYAWVDWGGGSGSSLYWLCLTSLLRLRSLALIWLLGVLRWCIFLQHEDPDANGTDQDATKKSNQLDCLIVLSLVQDHEASGDPDDHDSCLVEWDHFHLIIVLHSDVKQVELNHCRWWNGHDQTKSEEHMLLEHAGLHEDVHYFEDHRREAWLERCAEDKEKEGQLYIFLEEHGAPRKLLYLLEGQLDE